MLHPYTFRSFSGISVQWLFRRRALFAWTVTTPLILRGVAYKLCWQFAVARTEGSLSVHLPALLFDFFSQVGSATLSLQALQCITSSFSPLLGVGCQYNLA